MLSSMSKPRTPQLPLVWSVSRHSPLVIRHFLLVLAVLVVLYAPCAFALDPALDVSQYAHTAWKVSDGFTQGVILSVAQTPDGYLWLGTELGLYRFDGVRAVPWQPPAGQQLPGNRVYDLLLARDGTLWISTIKGLASWKAGNLTQYPELAGQVLAALLQDRGGAIWVGAFNPGRLCSIRAGKVQCYGEGSFGAGVINLYEDHKGNLWAASATGVWRWDSTRPEHYPLPGQEINAMIEAEGGELLLATSQGLKRLAGGKFRIMHFLELQSGFGPHASSAAVMAVCGSDQHRDYCTCIRDAPIRSEPLTVFPGIL